MRVQIETPFASDAGRQGDIQAQAGVDGAVDRAARFGSGVALRRAMLIAGEPFATPQDQIECADLLLLADQRDAARLLLEVAFVRAGFGRRQRAQQRVIAGRTGLWPRWDVPEAAPPPPAFAVDQAVVDLKRLIAIPSDPAAATLPAGLVDITDEDEPLLRREVALVLDLDGAAFAVLSTDLYLGMRGGDRRAVGLALDRIGPMLARPEYRLGDHFNAGVRDLAAMIAFNGYRRFLLLNHPLCFAPSGSPALIAAAASVEDGGLGPYLTNMACLIRTHRDVLGLLRLAGLDTGPAHRAALERWCVLLSTHLDRDGRVGLADELGDMGLMRALEGMFDAARTNPGRDHYLFWAIRDAALDNGDTALAIAAQTMIARLSGNDARELVVLAEILVTAEDGAAAEAVLLRALARTPEDRGAAARLAALREDRFLAYRAERGFASSQQRSALRMRYRAERAAAADAGDAMPAPA